MSSLMSQVILIETAHAESTTPVQQSTNDHIFHVKCLMSCQSNSKMQGDSRPCQIANCASES
jgi:hypothetical protein